MRAAAKIHGRARSGRAKAAFASLNQQPRDLSAVLIQVSGDLGLGHTMNTYATREP
jgi:hypothetical protein